MIEVCRWFLVFVLYSFLGWLCETIFCSVPARKFVNRGMLMGPFCPIYGFGALLVIALLMPVADTLWLLYICGVLVTSVLEYLVGFGLERLFHMKWWDYSDHKLQLHGRVCLTNSLLFGLLVVVVMRFVHPFVWRMVSGIAVSVLPWLSLAVYTYFVADTVITVHSILQLNGKLQQMHDIVEELKATSIEYKDVLQQNIGGQVDRIFAMRPEEWVAAGQVRAAMLLERMKELESVNKPLHNRILHAFPHMRSTRYQSALSQLKGAIEARKKRKKQD